VNLILKTNKVNIHKHV